MYIYNIYIHILYRYNTCIYRYTYIVYIYIYNTYIYIYIMHMSLILYNDTFCTSQEKHWAPRPPRTMAWTSGLSWCINDYGYRYIF